MEKISLKLLTQYLVLFMATIQLSGCKSVSDEAPTRTGLITASWTLQELLIDGSLYSGDISAFKLTLNANNEYLLTDIDGTEINGTWQLINADTILKLDDNELIIVSLTSQNAELHGTTRNDKTGNRQIIYKLIKSL